MRSHLEVTTSDRGFDRLPPIPSEYGGQVEVYESSAASGPHVWLKVTGQPSEADPFGPVCAIHLHLTAENAWKLSEQLAHLVEHHYQGDARP